MKAKLLRDIRRIYRFEFHKLHGGAMLHVGSDYYRKRVVYALNSHDLAIRLAARLMGKEKTVVWVIKRRRN